jgi:hypothetical protein
MDVLLVLSLYSYPLTSVLTKKAILSLTRNITDILLQNFLFFNASKMDYINWTS